jgi:hypothetical protein
MEILDGKIPRKSHGNIPANWSFSSLGKAAEMEKPLLEVGSFEARSARLKLHNLRLFAKDYILHTEPKQQR